MFFTPFLPLLLLTFLWHTLAHPKKNSSPEFRVATRDFKAEELPGFCPPGSWGKQRFSNPSLPRKTCPLYFKLELRSHRTQSQFYTQQWSSIAPLSGCIACDPYHSQVIFLTTPASQVMLSQLKEEDTEEETKWLAESHKVSMWLTCGLNPSLYAF